MRLFAPPLLLVAAASCSGDDETLVMPPTAALSLVSFNAALGIGLAPYVPERAQALPDALAALDPDVLCLQELWQPSDLERIGAELTATPFSLHAVTESTARSEPACTEPEAADLVRCAQQLCGDLDDASAALCAIANCQEAFAAVSMGCQQCIINNQALMQPQAIAERCSSALEAGEAYLDQNGLLLLSRYPLEDTQALRLDSSFGERGVLLARIEVPALGSLQIGCTHLAATLEQTPYDGPHGSWQGERSVQVEAVLDALGQRSAEGPTALLGDLNSGPAQSVREAADAEAYERLRAAGYTSPFVEREAAPCTFCTANLLASDGESSTRPDLGEMGGIIDHVMLRGVSPDIELRADRVLDQPLEIVVDGEPRSVSYSDHYGVRVVLRDSRSNTP